MKRMLIGGRVWRSDRSFLENCPIVMENGRILSVGKEMECEEVIDLRGMTLLPGLVDVHTHGRGGYDFATADREQMKQLKRAYAKQGVTALFPSLASATAEEWKRALSDIEACGFDGAHLEGCYLHPDKRGAHAASLLVKPDAAHLMRVLEGFSLPCHITAAYELDKDGSFAACARSLGATLGLGHTNATAEEAALCIERGVTSFTHLFNTMPPLHHRAGGAACVGLTSDCFVELIVDGIHICPEMVHLAYKCKETDKFVLVTDSMEATGCADGEYTIAGLPVIVKDGKAVTVEGALAGSTLELWTGVKNLMRFTGAPLEDAIACATLNPARMVGIDKTVGSLDEGKRADILVVNDDLELVEVFAEGERVE